MNKKLDGAEFRFKMSFLSCVKNGAGNKKKVYEIELSSICYFFPNKYFHTSLTLF